MRRPKSTVLILSGAMALTGLGLVRAQQTPDAPPPATAPSPAPGGPTAAPEAPPPSAGEAPFVVPSGPGVAAEEQRLSAAIAEEAQPTPSPRPRKRRPKKEGDKGEKAGSTQAEADSEAGAPLKRPRHGTAILQAVDKTTAETLRFEAKVGKPVRYQGLMVTVRACETTAPDEPQSDSFANLEVQSQPKAPPGRSRPPAREVYKGWMSAVSPGLNPFGHPVYDLWLVSCKVSAPPIDAGAKKKSA